MKRSYLFLILFIMFFSYYSNADFEWPNANEHMGLFHASGLQPYVKKVDLNERKNKIDSKLINEKIKQISLKNNPVSIDLIYQKQHRFNFTELKVSAWVYTRALAQARYLNLKINNNVLLNPSDFSKSFEINKKDLTWILLDCTTMSCITGFANVLRQFETVSSQFSAGQSMAPIVINSLHASVGYELAFTAILNQCIARNINCNLLPILDELIQIVRKQNFSFKSLADSLGLEIQIDEPSSLERNVLKIEKRKQWLSRQLVLKADSIQSETAGRDTTKDQFDAQKKNYFTFLTCSTKRYDENGKPLQGQRSELDYFIIVYGSFQAVCSDLHNNSYLVESSVYGAGVGVFKSFFALAIESPVPMTPEGSYYGMHAGAEVNLIIISFATFGVRTELAAGNKKTLQVFGINLGLGAHVGFQKISIKKLAQN